MVQDGRGGPHVGDRLRQRLRKVGEEGRGRGEEVLAVVVQQRRVGPQRAGGRGEGELGLRLAGEQRGGAAEGGGGGGGEGGRGLFAEVQASG